MSDGASPDGAAPAPDPRLIYLGRYVQKTLKLKPEKWNRLLTVEEQKTPVLDFLNKPGTMVLIVLQNNAAQLQTSNSFPVSLKSKGVFFVKRKRILVPKEDIAQHIILGDMATKPIEQLAALVDEVFVPLLSNPENHKKWPPIVAQDVQKHVHSLKSTVYQVKGQVSGQTVLPMPVGVERVHEAEKLLIESGGEIVDLYLKSAIEGVVIKWATQINDVLIEESSQAFANGQNPTPIAEINFWSARLKNLEYIYDQLRDERVRKMAIILERTDSAYYPCFRTQFQNVVAALAEAKDIVLYLKPLMKHFSALEDTDFAEVTPYLQPLMHTVCLVWANSRYYCSSSKIIVLLRQICNLLIQQAKKFLDPASIFQSDIDESKQRVLESVGTLQRFRQIFEEYREKLGTFFHNREPVPWSFHPKIVFERYQAFLDRLDTIKRFFETVMEFTKLEKVVIGGLKGRQLSSKVVAVYKEFSELLGAFGSKSYDALDPEDFAFVNDYLEFQGKINDLDRRLASVLCQAFDDCCNLESIFKLIEIVGSVLERPLIKDEFTGKFDAILKMLNEEITAAMELYEIQMGSLKIYGRMPVNRNMPPVAGALCWANQLRQRMAVQVKSFLTLQHPIVSCPEAEEVVEKYYNMVELLAEFEKKVFSEWVAVVPEQCERNLQLSLLTRKKKSKELALNFHPQLAAILREVHYFNLMEHKDIPEAALLIYERNETFRKYTSNLNQTILWYNKVRQCTRTVEFALVEEQIKEIDALVEKGRTSLNWNSSELWKYIENLHNLVHSLETRVQRTQDNLMQIQVLMNIWNRVALFQRRDGKKDTLLAIEDRQERIQKRYAEISNAATEIQNLVSQNLKLFGLEEEPQSPKWLAYVNYVDSIVSESLLKTVGCSLGYLAENMDSNNNYLPLFETQLELRDPDLVFLPSLDPSQPDNFISLVEELIRDIIKMASLVTRITNVTGSTDYEAEMETNEDIVEMKREILDGVRTTIEEATEFSGSFESYSYLWLDDRETYMQQFLTYGHQLTPEELEAIAMEDDTAPKPCTPSMEQFREQIDNFENLYLEIEEMKPIQVFNSWFQVDLRPFRQALLNTVRKWGNMFKQHLVDHVTSSLSDLAKFIHEADEGLQQTVEEGDYDCLVNVMGYLMNVKERQLSTDDMFEPLRQTIELLKFYDQELPEEVNVLLQVKQGRDGAQALLYLLCFLLFHLPEPACS